MSSSHEELLEQQSVVTQSASDPTPNLAQVNTSFEQPTQTQLQPSDNSQQRPGFEDRIGTRTETNTNTTATYVSDFYNTILLLPSEHQGDICANLSILYTSQSKLNEDILESIRTAPDWPQTTEQNFLYRLFYSCKASRLQHCDNNACALLKGNLQEMSPGHTNWTGFELWAVQLAACLCSQLPAIHDPNKGKEFCILPAVIISAVDNYDWKSIRRIRARDNPWTPGRVAHPLKELAGKIVLSEVLATLSWLNGISTGQHGVLLEPIDRSKAAKPSIEEHEHGGLFTDLILNAIDRAKSFKLCPHRMWAIAEGIPGKEYNLPALIPPIGRISVVPHVDHDHCTFDFCEESSVNFTSVAQLHECQGESRIGSAGLPGPFLSMLRAWLGKVTSMARWKQNEGPQCNRTKGKFRQTLLNEPTLAGKPTAWKLDGVSIIEPAQRFMAISHVWADGTGVGAWPVGEVNECLYNFFRRIAEQFECEGIWWDTICIPQDRKARTQAINNMHENYAGARITLVHDLYLRKCEWIDAENACFAIVMSSWFTRGWTALELAKSRVVKVVFKSDSHGPVIKDLDDDILAAPGKPSSPWRQAATTAILNLRNTRTGIKDINGLLTSLGPRYTSWLRDKAIICGLLAGVEVPIELSEQEIYQRVLVKLGTIADGNFFHSSATMSRGFSWCPTSLLDLPLATSNFSSSLAIQDNGDVVGYWGVVAPTDGISTKYIWKDVHPLTKVATQFALRQGSKHLCLVERKAPFISRACL